MAETNRDRIGKALELLAAGLAPFVDQQMRAAVPGNRNWLEVWQARDRTGGGAGYHLDDPQLLLRVLTEDWRVFERVLGRNERNWAGELRQVRNDWAHNQPFNGDDTIRALDTAERLLAAVSAADQATEFRRARQDLLRRQYESETRKATTRPAIVTDAAPVSGLTPWREVAIPHADVAAGWFAQAEFAADLSQVLRGEGSPEYVDPVEFFRRTFLTAGLEALLRQAVERISGERHGVPVIDLQTNFGGGKTHSLLALYHLFSGRALGDFPQDVQDLLRERIGVATLPAVRRVVLVGTAISPSLARRKDDGTEVHTLWGELAWQLGGRAAYERVAAADRTATNPGDALRTLLAEHAPCLILIDEWVAYARQLFGAEAPPPGGSFDTQFTFAQALEESVRATPGALLVVSLPASDSGASQGASIEVGGPGGQEALRRLQNVVRRMDSPWRPASAQESFEIVRRRLFEPIATSEALAARDVTARRLVEYYRTNRGDFPAECGDINYEQRIKAAYPIHPELFDRLYADWSTLEKFQRTRGVLRLLAKVIHALWAAGDQAPLILPGSVMLADHEVEGELTRNLDDQWKPIIDADVDGEASLPAQLDREKSTFGQRQATRRVARTVFLGSAPTATSAHRGVEERRVRLGCALPGESPALFGDALRGLSVRATYLYVDTDRYWYSVAPSVNRKAVDRAEQLRDAPDVVHGEIIRRLKRATEVRGHRDLAVTGVHVTADSADVADEARARLVVVPPEHPHARTGDSPARAVAEAILRGRGRGSAARTYRNMLVFLVAEASRLEDLQQATREWLAWQEIVDSREAFNLDPYQVRQAEAKLAHSDEAVELRIAETYRWLLVPSQPDPAAAAISWQALAVDGSEPLVARASRKLVGADLLRRQMAPVLIRMDLDGVLAPLWQRGHVTVTSLWEAYASYLYLPRLRGIDVLLTAAVDGPNGLTWPSEGFAVATAYDETSGDYRGLVVDDEAPAVTASSLLVHPEIAQVQAERRGTASPAVVVRPGQHPAGQPAETATTPGPRPPTHFYGMLRLDPQRLLRDVGRASQEVLAHLQDLDGVEVNVTLEVRAVRRGGFDDGVTRTVSENAAALKFDQFGFEEH